MQSIRRAATRASLTSAVSTATKAAAPKTQSIAFALQSINAVRCFSVAAPRAFARSSVLRDEQQAQQQDQNRVTRQAPPSEHCAFIQNYPFNVSMAELTEAFSKFGKVLDLHVPKGKSFCFLYFDSAEALNSAVENVDGTFWHGRRIVVRPSEAKGRVNSRERPDGSAAPNAGYNRERRPKVIYDGSPTETIFIGNLSFDATDSDLNELFAKLKNVKDVRVAVDNSTGWPRGFAHAEFHNVEDAQKGIEAIAGQIVRGRSVVANYAPTKRSPGARGRIAERAERAERAAAEDTQAEAEAVQEEEQKKHQQSDWNA